MRKIEPKSGPRGTHYGKWMTGLAVLAVLLTLALVAANLSRQNARLAAAGKSAPAPPAVSTNTLAVPATNPPSLSVNEAVMVTAVLDFGLPIPTIAAPLREIERRSQPDDGAGRTFAILDAYGEPTPDGKLHILMHVSSEKTGTGVLVFKRTGEVLWQNKIVASTNAAKFTGKNLLIFVNDGAGWSLTVDGSNRPATILRANAKELGVSIESI